MATATVSADIVIRDGQKKKKLARIMEERKARDEAKIIKVMATKKIRYGFMGLKKRERSRQEALDYLDKNSFYGWRSMYCGESKKLIEKLIVLAQHGDPLTLSHEDAYAIWS